MPRKIRQLIRDLQDASLLLSLTSSNEHTMEFKHSLDPDPDHPEMFILTIKLSDRESIKFLPIARDEMPDQTKYSDWVKRYEQEVKPDQSLLINVVTAGLRQKSR